MSKYLIFLGGGGHASVLLDILRKSSIQILGYVSPHRDQIDLTYLGTENNIDKKYPSSDFSLVNAIGSISIPEKRM
jgi:hypothetical protein